MSDLNESLAALVKNGAKHITFGINEKGDHFCSVRQMVSGSGGKAQAQVNHEAIGVDHEAAYNRVKRNVEHCAALQGKILSLDSN